MVKSDQARAVSVWFKPEEITTNRLCIFNLGATNANAGWELLVDADEGLIGNWSGGTNYLSGGEVTAGQWHHAVFSYDDTMKLISLYLDGDLLGTYTNQVNTVSTSLRVGGPPLAAKDKKKRAGKDNNATAKEIAHGYFHGAIDEVRFYRRGMNEEDVGELYDAEKPTSWFWLYGLLFVLAVSVTPWVLYRMGWRIPAKLMNPILKRLPEKIAVPLARFKQVKQEPVVAEASAP